MAEDQESGVDVRRRDDDSVVVRIFVPELKVTKILTFQRDELVWNVKEQCIASLPKELKESFNYGLFYPPANGRAGKFLEEERPLSDYPFHGRVGQFELKYKRRVYKMLKLDEKQFRSINSRGNARRLLDYVASGQAEKVAKLCAKGLDPNFHHQDTGETPLSMAASLSRCRSLLLSLVGGGALLDYRTRCGSTALHRAAERNNMEAVRTLLDLGASPNYRDAKLQTPLYNAILVKADPQLCQALLHDYSIIGVQDTQGSQEVHQACRNGLTQQLEQLLYYGADMNARNASGNTPLHICAVNNQESCARLLLFRGASRETLNFANQTPHQVAVIAGNLDLAALIQKFRTTDVVPFKETPSFNPRRRRSVVSLRPSASSIALDILSLPAVSGSAGSDASGFLASPASVGQRITPPSPSPSDSWLQFSVTRNASSGRSDTGSEDNTSATASFTDKVSVDQCDVVSDSSGVGTSNSGGSYDATPTERSLVLPLMTVVCVEPYNSQEPGHLRLNQGDIIEVTGSTDCGLLEGWLRGESGFFPAGCVQEVRLRQNLHLGTNGSAGVNGTVTPRPDTVSRVNGRRELSASQYGTVPANRTNNVFGQPRTVILHRGNLGFGFVLRGAKGSNPLTHLQSLQQGAPGLQYLDSVEPNSVAEKAGLRPGDFILAINGQDVSQASHEAVVEAIRRSGSLVTMTVSCAVQPSYPAPGPGQDSRAYSTLPRKLDEQPPQPPKRDPRTTLSVGRSKARSMVIGLQNYESSPNKSDLEQIYSSTNGRTASIKGRTSLVSSAVISHERPAMPTPVPPPAPPPLPCDSKAPKVYNSVAEMKRMKKQKAVAVVQGLHKDFYSSPDLNAEDPSSRLMTSSWTGPQDALPAYPLPRSQAGDPVPVNNRHSWAFPSKMAGDSNPGARYGNSWQSIEELCNGFLDDPTGEDDEDLATPIGDQPTHIGNLPPPSFPPPPPPPLPSEVVRVEVIKKSDYAVSALRNDPKASKCEMSTFRPVDKPKLYASSSTGFATMRPSAKSAHSNPATRSLSLPLNSTRPTKFKMNRKEEQRVTVIVNSTPVIPVPDYDSEAEESFPEPPEEILSSSSPAAGLTAEILKAKSKLKPSLSVPDIDKQLDNKEVYITCLPVNNIRKASGLGRHAVSLVHLPPPAENGELDADSDAERMMLDSHSHRRLEEQDSLSTASTVSSMSTSSYSSGRDSLGNQSHHQTRDEKSIEECISLIRRNIFSLSDLESQPRSQTALRPPAAFDGADFALPPPPPEFCDLNRRDSDDYGKAAPRIIGAVPKRVSFSPDVIDSTEKNHKNFSANLLKKSCK